MKNRNDRNAAGMKELVCGVVVLVFAILGMAKWADRFDINVSKNATIADGCSGSNQNQACNKTTSNKAVRRI
jgi:hypothetical protein